MPANLYFIIVYYRRAARQNMLSSSNIYRNKLVTRNRCMRKYKQKPCAYMAHVTTHIVYQSVSVACHKRATEILCL